MGLSDEERMTKMVWAVNRLNELNSELTEAFANDERYLSTGYKKIQSLIDATWHALFGNETNSLHWFMGSGSGDTITTDSPATPWEIATTQQLEWRLPAPEGILRLDDENKTFNALDFSLSIPNLLQSNYQGKVDSILFQIYQWLEELSYALRRYNDKFRRTYKELDIILSRLYGECYSIFSKVQNFQEAYLAHEISKILYGPSYPYDKEEDVVTNILRDNNLHHDLSHIVSLPLVELAKTHKDLTKLVVLAKHRDDKAWQENYLLLEGRCIAVFELAPKGCFEYNHVKNKIIQSLSNSVLKKSLSKLENKIAECEKKINKKDEKLFKNEDLEKSLNAYGHYGWSEMYEFIKELEKDKLEPSPTKKKPTKKKKPTVTKNKRNLKK